MVKNKQAFTLIEVLVSVTIIILFSGMIMAYYNQQTAYKKLAQDADKLVDVLELAKKKAMAGDLDNYYNTGGCSTGYVGWQVFFSGSNYFLDLRCAGNTWRLRNYTLTDTVSINTFPTNNLIIFSPLTGSNNSLQTIKLYETSLGLSKAVTISINYGNISKN